MMDAFRRAQEFMRDGIDRGAETSAASGTSGKCGIRAEVKGDISLIPLPQPTVHGQAILSDHPFRPDCDKWTPVEKARYCGGCLVALEILRARLERGLVILEGRYTLAGEIRWFILATRATRLIGRLARASDDAEAAFLDSELGEWFRDLAWPVPSRAALRANW